MHWLVLAVISSALLGAYEVARKIAVGKIHPLHALLVATTVALAAISLPTLFLTFVYPKVAHEFGLFVSLNS